MKSSLALLVAAYRLAVPGYHYEFPRDHFNHPEFQTEWWYYTGNLRASDGHRFGFELTFFRHGVDRSNTTPAVWDVRDAWFAHLALSDIDGGRFLHAERMNRAGAGLAGASLEQSRVWNGNWSSAWNGANQRLRAIDERFEFDLEFHAAKPPVIHGVNGVSQKSEGEGRASHYVSLTRLETRGAITLEGRQYTVEGLTWMDHEFFTHQLDASQSGWDWFSLQFNDGTELMLFRLRRKDGSADPFSAGTYIDATGRSVHLKREAFSVTPGRTWKSYPVEWTVRVPSQKLDLRITTRLDNQELTGQATYWEGAVEATGTRQGSGYLEMTGYAAPVSMGE